MVSHDRVSPLLLAALTSLAACRERPPEKTNVEPNPHVQATSSVPNANAVGSAPILAPSAQAPAQEIVWTAPAAWVSAPNPNPMRKATYKIPKAGGDAEDGELAISAASGGVQQNVRRWALQFGTDDAKTEVRHPGGLNVTVVEITGTFSGGMMGGGAAGQKKGGQMLLGAIVDFGDSQTFFKATGGEKTMTAAKKDFDTFIASLRKK